MRLKYNNNLALLNFGIIIFLSALFVSCSSGTNKTEDQKELMQITNSVESANTDFFAKYNKAVCYSGFRKGQHPDRGEGAVNPSYDETLEDLKILAEECDFNLIRVYDSGENSELVLRVINENNIDLKVLLGIWLRAELSNHESCAWLTDPIPEEKLQQNKILNLIEIEKGIKLANAYKNIVVAVNVGNEALVDWNDHKVDTDTVISYVKKVKQSVEQEVSVADNYKWWVNHGVELAKVVDFISIHIYPVWEDRDINEGLSYSIENITEVQNAFPISRIVITEAGWPSVASEFSDQANEENQKRYYHELMNWSEEMNITTFIFEAFDEDWKGNPDNLMGAEKHWGLFTIDRKPKKVMQELFVVEN
jgi:exo-beta-1,3-glucanase (GH17 family)